jgi:hypothetical protein
MKVKVDTLIGPALDWAVAKCEGRNITIMRNNDGSLFPQPVWADGLWQCNYSTFWGMGGPIIEREKIDIEHYTLPSPGWMAGVFNKAQKHGPTPLIAAMRAYVASKMGDKIEVPEELK